MTEPPKDDRVFRWIVGITIAVSVLSLIGVFVLMALGYGPPKRN